MKYLAFLVMLAFGLTVGGCAHEARYIDKEHGLASNTAFDQQVVNKDYKYADKDVSGMDAIYAETVIGKYAESYSDSFNKIDVTIDNFKNENR